MELKSAKVIAEIQNNLFITLHLSCDIPAARLLSSDLIHIMCEAIVCLNMIY